MEVQNDGHTVDVLVGQLKVEVEELVLELELETVVEAGLTVGVGAVLVVSKKYSVSQGTCMISPVEGSVLEDKVTLEETMVLEDTVVLADDTVLELVVDVTDTGAELPVLDVDVEDDVGFTAHDD